MNQSLFQSITRAVNFLYGEETTAAGQGIEPALEHSWPWPPWVTLLLLIAAAAYVIAVYARESSAASRMQRALLAAVRFALICLVMIMMYGWVLHRHRTDLPDAVIVVDDSASMTHQDHYEEENWRKSLQRQVQAAGLDKVSRINQAKSVLLRDEGALLRSLAQKYNLKFYWLASNYREQAGDANQLIQALRGQTIDPHSQEHGNSRLGTGLRNILETQRGRPTAAIIMFTDGATTEGKSIGEVSRYARQKNVPLFLVGLGNDQPTRDVWLSDVLVDDMVFVGDLVHFDVKLTGTGYQGKRVNVRLKQPGRPDILAEEDVLLSEDDAPLSVRLTHRPTEKGDVEYVVEAAAMEGESNPDNNQQRKRVSVRDETIRVLLVQEYPNFEFRFLKMMLRRGLKRGDAAERAFDLTTVLQESDPDYAELDETARRVFPVSRDELFEYDVLIFGDVNPTFLSRSVMEHIVAFVKQRGGGIVFCAGPRYNPLGYRDTPLAQLIPFDLSSVSIPPGDAVLQSPFQGQLTRLGMTSPQLQLDDRPERNLTVWRSLPGLYWFLEAPDMRTGARVLVEHPSRTGNTGENLPLVSMQFVGAGKVIYHNTDETYRWSRHQDGQQYYTRYWMQTIRYLSRSKLLGKRQPAEMPADRDQYYRGETVRLRVRFLDERRAPAQDDGVTVVLEREGSQRRQIKLRRDATSRGIFEGSVANLAEGEYRAWMATPVLEDQPPSRRFAVVAPPGEQTRLEMDRKDLELAAKNSSGRFFTMKNVDRLLRQLPPGRQVRIESLPPLPVWNTSLLAAAFVALIVTEWLLRKRWGML